MERCIAILLNTVKMSRYRGVKKEKESKTITFSTKHSFIWIFISIFA